MVGLATPLHLAASLLALAAAVGLAVVLLEGDIPSLDPPSSRRRPRLLRIVGGAGALLYATGQALAGALAPLPEVVAWLQAAGLAGIAVGVSPRRMRLLAGPAVLIPIPAFEIALAGAAAGALAGVRVLFGGRSTALAGLGLLLLGAAQYLTQVDVGAAAGVTCVGAALLGAWLWRASAGRVLAKLVTTFVAALLALVVVMAIVLSTLGTAELVREQLARLHGFSDRLAQDITSWPDAAIGAVSALSLVEAEGFFTPQTPETNLLLFEIGFREQDYFIVFAQDGTVRNAYPPELGASTLLSLAGDMVITEIQSGVRDEGGGLRAVGDQILAFGARRVNNTDDAGTVVEIGVLVTGRLVNEVWAAEVAESLGVQVAVEVGGPVTVGSPELPIEAAALDRALGQLDEADLSVPSGSLYVAAAPLADPGSGTVLGRIITVSGAGVVSALEEAQARRLFLLALLGALLAGITAAVSTRRLVAPIRELTAAAERVREGDLSAHAKVATRDEIGRLGRTFNAMTESLSAQSSQLVDAAAVQSRLRARLEVLTQSMSDGLVAVDQAGLVIAFNPAAERLVGRTFVDVQGKPFDEVLHARTSALQPLAQLLGEPTSQHSAAAQMLIARPMGGWVPTAVTASPVRDRGGAVLGRVYVLRDVTRETEIERMKSEFLSNVSHELRTPLTPIKGYASVLARREVSAETARTFAQEILSSTSRLERIVGLIVDFAALDSGRAELRQEAVDLGGLLRDVLNRWSDEHPQRSFSQRLIQPLPRVLGDRTMLQRCLDELIDNAVKFSPGGEVVTVRAAAEPAPLGVEPQVRVSITDRGVGIDQDLANRIFTDFFQGDATETRHFGGLGLGLALVRRIVDQVGGAVEVESVLGRGTTVHLLLPTAPGSDFETVPPPVHAARRGPLVAPPPGSVPRPPADSNGEAAERAVPPPGVPPPPGPVR